MAKLRVFIAFLAGSTLLAIGISSLAGDTLHFKSGDVVSRANAALANQLSTVRPLDSSKSYYVIQFTDKIGRIQRQDLAHLGVDILRYVPDDALIIRATGKQVSLLQTTLPLVQAVLPFAPAWKVAQEFTPNSVFSAGKREQILLRLFTGDDIKQMEIRINSLPNAQILASAGQTIVANVSRSQVDQVAEFEGIEWVQPNPEIELLDAQLLDQSATPSSETGDYSDLTGYESGTKLMNVDAAWAIGLSGQGQIASMADTGLDKGDVYSIHQDFAGRIPSGLIFGISSKSWEDPVGHGTHVSGCVVGSGAASGGILRGSAFEANYIPESMWSPILANLSVPTKLSQLFSQAYAAGARIHSNSWGASSGLGSYDGFAQQVDEFAASNPDMLILFAAGNGGVDADKDGRVDPGSISSPATAKNVLTVGASKNYVLKGGIQLKLRETKLKAKFPAEPLASSKFSENQQGIAAFSARGPTEDGRLKPEILAPGTNILSVRTQVAGADVLWGAYNKDYVWSGGTSMAAPLTAGAATLVRQYLVENRKIPDPSSALLKAVLIHTANELYPGQFGAIGQAQGQEILTRRPNNDEGYGRVDLRNATMLQDAILIDERTGLATGEVKTYPLTVSGSAQLTATMVYTDAAATESAKTALVNDLDLILIDSSGNKTSLNDHLNNSEMLDVALEAGDYQVMVNGTNVPQGPVAGKQPYALVLTLH